MKKVVTIIAATGIAISLPACKVQNDESDLKQFFAQSKRRTPSAVEAAAIANLAGCAAFFVANTKNLNYIATARHCAQYKITEWCDNGGTVRAEKTGDSHTCKRVIAGKSDRDIALVEVDGPINKEAFRLASFAPAPRTRLTMIGYPGDSFQKGQLTLTENCYVHRSNVPSPYIGNTTGSNGNALRDQSYTHNCTTYGGNSGGPMFVEKTNIAVGLPFTYHKDSDKKAPLPESAEAHGAQMKDFVDGSRAALEEAGVVFATSATEPEANSDTEGEDLSDEINDNIAAMITPDNRLAISYDADVDSAIICRTVALNECTKESRNKIVLSKHSQINGKAVFVTPAVASLDDLSVSAFVAAGYQGSKKNSHAMISISKK